MYQQPSENKNMREGTANKERQEGEMRETWVLWNGEFQLGEQREQGGLWWWWWWWWTYADDGRGKSRWKSRV